MTEVTERPTRGSTSTRPIVRASHLRTIRCFPPTVAPRIFTVGQPKLDGWLLAGTGSAGLKLPPAASSVLDARNSAPASRLSTCRAVRTGARNDKAAGVSAGARSSTSPARLHRATGPHSGRCGMNRTNAGRSATGYYYTNGTSPKGHDRALNPALD